MDNDKIKYKIIPDRSLLNKTEINYIQNKTSFIEDRLNTNVKVLQELRNSITSTYELHEKTSKDILKIIDKYNLYEKKVNIIDSRLNTIELKFIDIEKQMKTLLEFTEKFMKNNKD